MSNKTINTQFDYLGMYDKFKYDYKNKRQNINNKIAYMLNRSLIMFKYHNLPDSIPYIELERQLQIYGFSAITKVDDKLYCFIGGLGGIPDEYYRPTEIIIDNPYLNFNKTLQIDKDCVIIKNDSNYMGLIPLYSKYCSQLTEAEITLMLALINKRIQTFLTASDDNTKASAEGFIKKIIDGDLSVIGTSQLFDSFTTHDATDKSTKTLTEIYEIIKYIKGDMFNEIGLSSYNTVKKERVSNAELELNSDNLYPLIDDMLANRRTAIDKINAIYGTDIQVELNSSWDYRVYNGMGIHNTKEETNINNTETNETIETTENNNNNPETIETSENE